MNTDVEVVLVAAGQGRRMGGKEPKAFLSLAGQPLFTYAARMFSALEEIAGIILVVPAELEERAQVLRRQKPDLHKIRTVIVGGVRRQDSVRNGLDQLRPETRVVLVHDAARPFTPPDVVRRVLAATRQTGAALPGIPMADTLKRVRADGCVESTVDRRGMVTVQTPQGFRRDLLEAAYRHAWEQQLAATDDAGLVEALGHDVAVVEGDPGNFKLTKPSDLKLAQTLLARGSADDMPAGGREAGGMG